MATKQNVSYPQMGGFVLCVGGAVTALLCGATLEAADLLQDREAAVRSLAAITLATIAMATGGGNTVGAGASLDLGKGDLQTGQWMFSVFVMLSVVPVLVLQSC